MQLNNLPNPHLYFAYGSNLDPEQMDWRCPDAIALGAARLNDWAWRIGGRGYATVSPSPGHHVWGAIWNVSDSDLASLDRYEGVAGGLYRREITTVMAHNQPIDVHLYIENYDDHGMPRPDYLERIIAGARWFDLPQAWIANLAAIEAA
jgi:gamma-glutamylcyclotransferase (GGCT)/AIG2-like uncharacterized protein YtfP